MKTIEEKIKEFATELTPCGICRTAFDAVDCEVNIVDCIWYKEIYKALTEVAKEQRKIDDASYDGKAILYIANKVEERTKKEMIDKAKEAFNKACGWLSTYSWYPAVLDEFIKALEE